MSHKDPVTGCIVANLYEIVSGEELMEMYSDLEKDIKLREQELMQNPLPFIQEAVAWINEGCEPEDMFPNPVSASVLEVNSNFGFGGTEEYVIADITWEGGKQERLKFFYGDNGAGSFYEPPCAEYEIWENPVLKSEKPVENRKSISELRKELGLD